VNTIQRAADYLLASPGESQRVTETRGLVAGALFSLTEARKLGGSSPRFPDELAEFSGELDTVLGAVRRGETGVPDRWLAGFHLNSAVLRLAFSAERALKIINPPEARTARTHLLKLCGRRKMKRNFYCLINDARRAGTITAGEKRRLHKLRRDVNSIKHDPADLAERDIRTLDHAVELIPIVQKLLVSAREADEAHLTT
jgi:hypothetical protein